MLNVSWWLCRGGGDAKAASDSILGRSGLKSFARCFSPHLGSELDRSNLLRDHQADLVRDLAAEHRLQSIAEH